jgi:uncharacterized protein
MAELNQPLSDAEYVSIANMLARFRGGRAMNLEMLDGFFAALICSPNVFPPSEYLREIWGDAEEGWEDEHQLQHFLGLIMRHWNAVAHTLNSAEPFVPYLLKDERGVACANDWARGFMRGMEMRRAVWLGLMNDEEQGGLMVPVLALAHEHDPDPQMRPYKEPASAERRRQLIMGVAASVPAIYRYFASHRRSAARLTLEEGTYRRLGDTIGRNEPCPCGSGKKFKKCCGQVTLH